MDAQLTELLLGITALVLSSLVPMLKRQIDKKGVSEEQADMVLDYCEKALAEVRKLKPEDADFQEKVFRYQRYLSKARRLWDKESVTTEDLKDFLDGF